MDEKTNVEKVNGSLGDINVQIIVELGRTKKPLSEISKFGEGTIFELDKLAGEPVDVFAQNVLVAHGEVVVIDENFGIRLTEVLGWPEGENKVEVE